MRTRQFVRRQPVRNGIDNARGLREHLSGKRLALITGPTGVNHELRSTVSILHEQFTLTRLFAPEHGLRGEAQAGDVVENYRDAETGLTVYSLYRGHDEGRAMPPEQLADIDAVVFDMQDVGARFYTYLYTLTDAMIACARAGVPLIVLDRVNPVGLSKTEGPVLDEGFASFVGRYAIPTRYALTVGEFAGYINATKKIGCQLSVVPCVGYTRDTAFADTDLCWVLPSPNMPTPLTALAYIGTCLFEGTNLSEGRGTVKPFEIIGAPWLNAKAVVAKMQQQSLDGVSGVSGVSGVKWSTVYFKPTFSKHCQTLCQGVQLHITDTEAFSPFCTGLYLLDTIRQIHTEFAFLPPTQPEGKPFITHLLGSDRILQADFDAKAFVAATAGPLRQFNESSAAFHLY